MLAVPAAVLIGFAFAGAGLAATTFMRIVRRLRLREHGDHPALPLLGHVLPAVALSRRASQAVIRFTPLYQGVVLERSLVLGDLHWTLLLNAAYLRLMGAVGLRVAARRLGRLLQP